MALISLQDVSMGFGRPLLIEGVQLQIERGEKVCLLGRNGAGKSTLLKLINGDLPPDSGEIIRQKGCAPHTFPRISPKTWKVPYSISYRAAPGRQTTANQATILIRIGNGRTGWRR